MTQSLDIYFDFASTYTYVVHRQVADLARRYDLTLNWKAVSLGAIFHQLGHELPAMDSPKQKYLWHDVERSARGAGLDFKWPDPFPFNSIPAARGFYWVADIHPTRQEDYIAAVFRAAFAEGRNVGDPAVLKSIVEELGLDGAVFSAALNDQVVKTRLKQETAAAQARDVFGAPTCFFGDEMFWGADRLPALEAHIRSERGST